MVSVCLPSDALLQHLPSYLGFSYLGCGVSLHGCSSKAQPLLLTLDEGYLLTASPPDLEIGVAPLGPQHSENEDHGIWSHHFTGNRWGNSGNRVRLYFFWVPKSLQMVTAAMKLKAAYSLEGKLGPT